MVGFWVFVGFAVVVAGFAAFLSIDENNNNMYFILYDIWKDFFKE